MILTNHQIAQRLRKEAMELARGGSNLYRVRAFRQAAMTVLGLPQELSTLVSSSGPQALEWLPGVGKTLGGDDCELFDRPPGTVKTVSGRRIDINSLYKLYFLRLD